MTRIFKYELKIEEFQTVKIPKGSVILSAVNQRERLQVYALVDDKEQVIEETRFLVLGTGHCAEDVDEFCFLQTVLFESGKFVIHVFTDGVVQE